MSDDFQKMLNRADAKLEKKKEEEQKLWEEDKPLRMLESIEFADYIKKMIKDILENIDSKRGDIIGFDSKTYGILNKCSNTRWELTDEYFQIVLDFSYEIPLGQDKKNPEQGFKAEIMDWDYLCELLKEDGIRIDRFFERGIYNSRHYGDTIFITIDRQKNKTR